MSLVLIIGVIAALAVGFVAGRLSVKKAQLQAEQHVELHNTKTEFDRYKAEVAEHLRETSELMHAAESNYQQLSEQLSRTKELVLDVQALEPAPHGAVPTRSGQLPPKDYAGSASGLLKEKAE